MDQVDFATTQGQYDAMMTVLDGIRTKLGGNKATLTYIFSMENGQAKIKAFAQTDDGRWLREVKKFGDDWNEFLRDVGWRDD